MFTKISNLGHLLSCVPQLLRALPLAFCLVSGPPPFWHFSVLSPVSHPKAVPSYPSDLGPDKSCLPGHSLTFDSATPIAAPSINHSDPILLYLFALATAAPWGPSSHSSSKTPQSHWLLAPSPLLSSIEDRNCPRKSRCADPVPSPPLILPCITTTHGPPSPSK